MIMDKLTIPLKVAIYIRVSTSMQVKENLSLEDQKKTLLKWAKESNYQVVKIYEDAGVSAFKGKRRQYEEMLNDIENKVIQIDCIAVYDSSRFSRNEANRHAAENLLTKHGVKLFSYLDCIPDDADDAFLFKGFNGLFNESFSRKNSKRSALKLNDVAKEGNFTGAPPPFGYQSVPVPKLEGGKQRKVLAIQPENAKIVKQIFSLYLTGKCGIPYGTKKVAAFLNENDILKNDKKWTANSVHRILVNPVYIGKREYGHTRSRTDLHDEIIIVPTPIIISEADFKRVEEIRHSRPVGKKSDDGEIVKVDKGLQSPKLLTGFLKCDKCGCNLVIDGGKGGQYKYYKCRDQIKCSVNVCNCPIFSQQKIENVIMESLHGVIFNSSYIASIYDNLKEKLVCVKKEQSLEKAILQRKWNLIDDQVSNLISNIAEGKLVMSSMVRRHLKLYEDKLASVERSINDIDRKSSLPLMNFGKNHIDNFVRACEKVLLGGNVEATKALLIATVKEIRVYEDKLVLKGGKLQLLANVANNKKGNSDGVPCLISMWR